ncbi:MAG: hypothetical protein R6V85_08950 [Polyangia bacterium]
MSIRRRIDALLAALLALALLAPGDAGARLRKKEKDPEEEIPAEVDHIALASMMLTDGYFDRAAAVLSEVDTEAEGLDLARYHMLFGLVSLERSAFGDAESHLEASLEAGQQDPMVHVFLAQARFGNGDYAGTLAALDAAGAAAESLAGSYRLRAQCHWKLERREQAFYALSHGLERFPDDAQLARYRVLLLVEMGLYQQAMEEGRTYLERAEASADDHASISEALIRGGQAEQAILILEGARLRFPASEEIALQLARAYLRAGRPLTAARLFRSEAHEHPELLLDAAELFKKGGRPVQALYLNADVVDQRAKIRQRLGLLIELERFEEAAALEPRLERLGLLDEDSVVYALAYSLFQIGKHDAAESYLERIRDPRLFKHAMELRRSMERCRAMGWECL